MLKILFASLLLVNAILLGAHFGWLDALLSSTHEPQRLKSQINADKLHVLRPAQPPASPPSSPAPASSEASSAESTAPATSAAPATPPASPAPGMPAAPAVPPGGASPAPAALPPAAAQAKLAAAAAAGLSCTEIGHFGVAEARRFESRLLSIRLPHAPERRETKEESSHMVWIPPLPTGKEGAEKKIAELRRLGVNDFFVLQDTAAQRHGISLGVFKSEDAARAQLAKLTEKGVKSARLIEHRMPLTRVSFRLRGLEGQSRAAVAALRGEFPRSEEKACSADAAPQ